jgi:dimethylhistidine N-methyltransferase
MTGTSSSAPAAAPALRLLDLQPEAGIDVAAVLAGLRQPCKQVEPKYFYDEAGSQLFEQICRQPEYYPTRTELGIMASHVDEMAGEVGAGAALIEFGAGSGRKTRLLLENLESPAAYVPVDISREFLLESAGRLARRYPDIEVLPVCADFTQPLTLPEPSETPARNVVYFPGSTIGNFAHAQALELLRMMRAEAGDNGGLLIGVDLLKSPDILEPAYNDSAGVTAAFNLNLLARFNRELNADFDLDAFRHLAVFDQAAGRIEMRLVSQRAQRARVAGEIFEFAAGEYIITEHSHKYTMEQFTAMAAAAGFRLETLWTDPEQLFSVQYLAAA